jgi:hypothetical protein
MRRHLLVLLLVAAAPLARASVITFDTITPNVLGFTVEWGPSLQGGFFTQSAGPGGPTVMALVEPDDQFGPINRVTIDPLGAGFPTSEVTLLFPNAPSGVNFADAQVTIDSHVPGAPVSITPTADGYGARFVYDPPGPGVPDGGSTLALLGLAAATCLGWRRRA